MSVLAKARGDFYAGMRNMTRGANGCGLYREPAQYVLAGHSFISAVDNTTNARPANNIRKWLMSQLDERQISVAQFAHAAGVSRASIYFWINDRYRPSLEQLTKICRALNVPLEEGLRQFIPRKRGRPVR